MNFLAHIYLSGNDKLLMIGNFMGDAIKGGKYKDLQPVIRKGVLMHRAIDDFTDRHPVNFKIRRLLHPEFGKYAGVYLDIFYDHFLAADWNHFVDNVSLQTFCLKFYFNALSMHKHLPVPIRNTLYALMYGNRLKNYSELESLKMTLDCMHKHYNLPRTGEDAVEFLENNYDTIKEAFYEFFPLLINYTKIWRERTS